MPIAVEMSTDTRPTESDTRPPNMSLEKTSRPVLSVPKRCFQLGERPIEAKSRLKAAPFVKNGTAMARRESRASVTAPTMASLCLRNRLTDFAPKLSAFAEKFASSSNPSCASTETACVSTMFVCFVIRT